MARELQGVSIGSDQVDSLVTTLDLIRSGTARTRPELAHQASLGRALVAQRVAQLIDLGLVVDGDLGPSTGGRAPRQLRFRAEAGHVLVAELGATSVSAGVATLAGDLLAFREEPLDVASGPERCLRRVEDIFTEVLADPNVGEAPVWGVGVGVPGPVEFATGRPTAPPIMPGWDDYPIRERFSARYDVPVWVDNEVNVMALGELRAGSARGQREVLYVKIGSGIGAGLIADGRLHRGSQGCAGDIGHVAVVDDDTVICRCGNRGCLEAVAGGAAIGRIAEQAARDGESAFLADILDRAGHVTAADVATAARHGDPFSYQLIVRTGRTIGDVLASFISFFNPSLILVGGGVTGAGDAFLATIRESAYRRALPLATRDLRLIRSPLGDQAGMMGAAFMVADELLSRERVPLWLAHGSPVGRPDLAGPPASSTGKDIAPAVPMTSA